MIDFLLTLAGMAATGCIGYLFGHRDGLCHEHVAALMAGVAEEEAVREAARQEIPPAHADADLTRHHAPTPPPDDLEWARWL